MFRLVNDDSVVRMQVHALSQCCEINKRSAFDVTVCSVCGLCCFGASFIVTGDVLGHVKFFDQELKLLHW